MPPVTPGYHPSPTTRPVVSPHKTLRGFLSRDQPKHYRIICGNSLHSHEPHSVSLNFITARESNVCSRICMSVIMYNGGSPCDHYPWCIGPHHTGKPTPGPLGHGSPMYRDPAPSPSPASFPPPAIFNLELTPRHVQTISFWGTYGWQACGSYPTVQCYSCWK